MPEGNDAPERVLAFRPTETLMNRVDCARVELARRKGSAKPLSYQQLLPELLTNALDALGVSFGREVGGGENDA